jgi:DNA repair protein RecN (Recombination protein N)
MLKHLVIKNYALIENLDAVFHEGFSVMTGETGAGKSIIIGALSLILGKRADLQSLKDKSKKCVVEGIFHTGNQNLKRFFVGHDLDFDPENTILRREILPSGKSRAFINDTPAGLAQLRDLAARLVDMHSQNSSTLLQSATFQLDVIDSFCDNAEMLNQYKKLYADYRELKSGLNHLRESEKAAGSEQDFYTFQLEELEKAELKPGEQHEIEEELELLNHAEEIKTRLLNVLNMIEGERGLNSLFAEIFSEVKPLKGISAELTEVFNRIESNYLDISDIASELGKIDERVEVNPAKAGELNDRLNLIYHLQQKHRVNQIEELLRIKDDYLQKITQYKSLAHEIALTEKELVKKENELKSLAGRLSERRRQAKMDIEKQVIQKVSWLGMPDAKVNLKMTATGQLTETGMDQVTFYFNANKGGEMQEMSSVASGGELSRLMLAFKSLIAAKNLVSTIIFDEIDSGVSGEVAGKMASIMQMLSKDIQVISITHLPQIAARGRHHYLVSKESVGQTTITSVKLLPESERISEIAKMLSDSKVSDSARQTAAELMKN